MARVGELVRNLSWPRWEATPDWGIEAVPRSARTMGTLDNLALWGKLGFSFVLMLTGALLVPQLSLGVAFGAIVIGALVGNLLLALVALIGAETGLPSAALLRAPLGIRGSYLASAFTVLRNVLWGTLTLVIMAEVAAGLTRRLVDVETRPLWVILFGALATATAVLGPYFIIRQLFTKFLFWLAVFLFAITTLTAFGDFGITTLLRRPATGGWPSFWQGVDLVVALPVLWLPLVADYSRFARDGRSAFLGSFAGYFLATVWLPAFGMLYFLAVGVGDVVGFLLGGVPIGIFALLLVLVMETDKSFANLYSSAVSIQNVAPWTDQRRLTVAVGVVSIALALAVDMIRYENLLLLVGSIFIPLFGILVADYFVLRRRRLEVKAFYQEEGPFWYQGGINVVAMGVWALGFLIYNWIDPGTVSWWVGAMDGLFDEFLRLPFPLMEEVSWLGASIPSFLAGFILYAVLGSLALRLRMPRPALPIGPQESAAIS